jgi:aminoglycoside phosphotransferase
MILKGCGYAREGVAPQLESAAVKNQSPSTASGETERMEAALADLLLSSYPAGSEIRTALSYQPGSRRYTMRVGVRTPGGGSENCVIKAGEQIEWIEREADLLRALGEVGLAVPTVIAGPVTLDTEDGVSGVLVMTELRGQPLPWFGTTSLAKADLACRLTIRGVLRLHQLTESVRRHSIASALPHVTLSSELEEIRERGGEWWKTDLFMRAAEVLSGRLADAGVPLVFSNGDYNPLNFLHEAEALTGWIDFEHACFEDPHIGFVKFLLWSLDASGWGTGVKAGLVERYLYAQNVSRREFAPRLVLRCLRHLQREVSINGEADSAQRRHMLGLLAEGVSDLEAGSE